MLSAVLRFSNEQQHIPISSSIATMIQVWSMSSGQAGIKASRKVAADRKYGVPFASAAAHPSIGNDCYADP